MLNHNYKNKTAVITGGGGALGSAMARGLAAAGVKVAILGRTKDTLDNQVSEIRKINKEAIALPADVLDRDSLEKALTEVVEQWGGVDILVNAAGGNVKGAVIMPDDDFFDMPMDDFSKVTDLNIKGTVLPTLVFGRQMAKQKSGSIINISSMAAQKPLTRVGGYAASKAAIDNFTKWLYGPCTF